MSFPSFGSGGKALTQADRDVLDQLRYDSANGALEVLPAVLEINADAAKGAASSGILRVRSASGSFVNAAEMLSTTGDATLFRRGTHASDPDSLSYSNGMGQANSSSVDIYQDVDLNSQDLNNRANDPSGAPTLGSVGDWTTNPGDWKVSNGIEGTSGAGVTFGAAGVTFACRDAGDNWTAMDYAPVAISKAHTSIAYTATVTLDDFSNLVADITGAENAQFAIYHSDGGIPHGAWGGLVVWYDPNGLAGQKWQLYKQIRRPGDTGLQDSDPTNIGNTTPTSLELTIVWLEGSGYRTYFRLNGSGGLLDNEVGGTDPAAEYTDISQPATGTTENSPIGAGVRSFHMMAGQTASSTSDVVWRVSDLTVT